MIFYTEKGIGLHEAISAAGHWMAQVDGVWRSSDDPVVQAIIDGYTLDKAKAAKAREVMLKAKSLRDRAVTAISAGEMASWPIKRAEANAYIASGGTAACPMLAEEAAARAVTLAELVAKVIGNAQAFGGLEAAIGGTDGRHRDAIQALTDFAAVASYDYSAGWPAV